MEGFRKRRFDGIYAERIRLVWDTWGNSRWRKPILALAIALALVVSQVGPTAPKIQITKAANLDFTASRGSANNKTSGTTLNLTPTGTIPAGELAVVRAVSDNLQTTDGTSTDHTVSDSKSNAWTKIREHTFGGGAAAAGVTVSLWYSKVTTSITTSDTVTLTISSAVTAKAMSLDEYDLESGYTVSLAGANGNQGTSTAPTVSLSSLASKQYLWLGAVGIEGPGDDHFVQDTDYSSPNGNNIGTTGGTNNTNVGIRGGYRKFTGTSDTFDPPYIANSDLKLIGTGAAGTDAAPAETISIPTHQSGDLIVIGAWKNNTTAPSLPSGWTSISTGSANGTSNRIGYRVATSNSETSGTWTGATHMTVYVFRGQHATPIGGNGGSSNVNGSVIRYSALTMAVTDGSSWIIGTGGRLGTITDITATTGGKLNTHHASSERVQALSTFGGVTAFSSNEDATVGSGTARGRGGSVEIRGANVASRDWAAVIGALEAVEIQTVSGTAYNDEASTAWTGCDGSTANLSLVINGGTAATTSCSSSTGAFDFGTVSFSSGDPISVFFNTAGSNTDKGVVVTVAGSGADIVLNPRKNVIWLKTETGVSNITNTNLNHCDSDAPAQCANVPYAVSGGNLTAETGTKIRIESGKTYAPGGNVTTPKLHIQGTYTGGSETLTLSGTGSGTSCGAAAQMPLCVDGTFNSSSNTTKFTGDGAVTIAVQTYNNLDLTPTITSNQTYTFGSGALTINGNFNINPTASSALALTVNMGAAITVGAAKTTTITRTTSATSNLDTTASNYALSTGKLDIATGGTLTANGSTITLTGTSGTLFTRTGNFVASSSTVVMSGDCNCLATSGAFTGSNSFNNLVISPTLGSVDRFYSLNSSPLEINGDFTINPTATAARRLTVTAGSDVTVADSKTITVQGSGSGPASSVLDTGIDTSASLTAGRLALAANGGLNANDSLITLRASSGTVFSKDASATVSHGLSTVKIVGDGSLTAVSGDSSFASLVLAPGENNMTDNRTYTLSGALTVQNNFLIVPTRTSSGSRSLTVNMGGHINVGGITRISGGGAGPATSTLVTKPSDTSYNLTTGDLKVETDGTLDAGSSASTINIKRSYANNGVVNAGTSNFSFNGSSMEYLLGLDSNSSGSGSGSGSVLSLTVSGSYLYVGKGANSTACSQTAGGASGCELMVFDISTPTAPTYVAGRDSSGSSDGSGSASINSLTVSGSYLYVGKGANSTACSQTAGGAIGCELMVFDISTPTAPTYVAGRDANGSSDGSGFASITSLTVSGSYLYVGKGGDSTACSQTAGGASGCELMVFDISTPTAPTYVAGRDANGSSDGSGSATINSLTVSGSYLYVGKGANSTACSQTAGGAIGCELMVFDISTPTAPTYVAGRDSSGSSDGSGSVSIFSLTVSGSYLYVGKSGDSTACSQTAGGASGCELMVFDISTPTAPTYVAGRDSSGSSDGSGFASIFSLTVSGSYLYVGKGANSTACSQTAGGAIGCELMVFDISTPTAPTYVAGRDSSGSSDGSGSVSILRLTVSGSYLYVGKGANSTACSQTAGGAIGCELMVFSARQPTWALSGSLTGSNALYDLTFAGGGNDWELQSSLQTVRHLNISAGGLKAASHTLTVGGNWTNSGTFTAGSGTVVLDGTATQTLSGTMTGSSSFYNLTITNNSGASATSCERDGFTASVDFDAAATVSNNFTITTANVRIEYNSGSTYTFTNINWNGQAAGTRIFFRNSAASGTWLLNVSGTQTAVSYVNVSRSDASGGNTINAADGTNVDCGNNTNWNFDASTFEQAAYRFGFSNGTNTDIVYTGAPSQDTPLTIDNTGDNFRLRLLIHVGGSDLSVNGNHFKLQFGEKTAATCASGVSWSDVATGAGVIRYYNDSAGSDGDAISNVTGDPSHSGHTRRYQTYEETNNFTNSQAAIAAGEDGVWDFSLINHSAVGGKKYCFRVFDVTGNDVLDSYSVYPEIAVNEELIFTLDATSKNFGVVQPGDNPTERTSTVTVSTNSSTGYIVYAWATQKMTLTNGFGTFEIPDWTGSNATPTAWPDGSFGFGYTTDDGDLTGGTANRFTDGGPKFAAFVNTGPGDPVADRSSGPVSSAANNITYRLAAGTGQQAGTYNTIIVYVVSVTF